MKTQQFTKKLMTGALISMLGQSAYASTGGACNASDKLNGWGAWCGIDTFLSQQEPTAAGPVDGNNFGFSSASFDSNEFGGNIEQTNTPTVTNTTELIGYAFFNNEQEFGVGKFSLFLDDDNQEANLSGHFDTGQAIDSNSNFYERNPTYLETGNRAEKTPASQLIEDYWYAYTYANSDKRQPTDLDLNQEPANIQDFTYGYVYGYSDGIGYGNNLYKATDLVEMNNLKTTNATTNFSVNSYGYDTKSGSRNENHTMDVNFGEGKWSMNNFYATNTNGTITGNTFEATSMVATNKRVIRDDSFVEGTFVGTNASQLTGMANIVKLKSKTNDTVHKNIKVILNGSQSR